MKIRNAEGVVPSTESKELKPQSVQQQELIEDTKHKNIEKAEADDQEDIENEAKLTEFQEQEQKLIEEINILSNQVEQNEDEEEKQEN